MMNSPYYFGPPVLIDPVCVLKKHENFSKIKEKFYYILCQVQFYAVFMKCQIQLQFLIGVMYTSVHGKSIQARRSLF
jgi:hypothetical protein